MGKSLIASVASSFYQLTLLLSLELSAYFFKLLLSSIRWSIRRAIFRSLFISRMHDEWYRFKTAETNLKAEPTNGSSVFGTILSKKRNCLICPLQASTTQRTAVVKRVLFASSRVNCRWDFGRNSGIRVLYPNCSRARTQSRNPRSIMRESMVFLNSNWILEK